VTNSEDKQVPDAGEASGATGSKSASAREPRGLLRAAELTRGRLLARNAALSLSVELVPMAAALVAMPFLLRRLGADRFGLLSLAWVVVGYFGLFDLGLGKALTKLVASKVGEGKEADVPPLVATALVLMACLGLVGGGALAGLSPWLVHRWLAVPPVLQGEALDCFRILALAIPIVIVTSGLRGLLEAEQRMGMLMAIRLPIGFLSYAGPLAVLPFSASLIPVVAVLAGLRVASLGLHLAACFRAVPALRRGASVRWADAPALLRFGGWMTVSNVVSPVLVMADRFLIGALVSIRAVAYYATPLDVVNNAGVIPGAIATVLFPAFATSYSHDKNRTASLYAAGLKLNLALMFPVALALAAFAREGLALWLGEEFALRGAPVVRWIAIGLLVNALARVAFWLVQGVGRPDLPAKFHVLEMALYFPLLWWATRTFGITGAAAAWTGRVVLDAGLLLVASQRLVAFPAGARGPLAATGAAAIALVATIGRAGTVGFRTVALAALIVGFIGLWWRVLLSAAERTWVRNLATSQRDVEGIRA
jgi:O-antigen/teichoic acid export membrane protein